MVDFTAALQQLIGPRLSALGFKSDPRLSQADELFAVSKTLSADRQAVIQFQRSHNAAVYHFTINLISARSVEHQPGYEIEHGARLSYVLWFVHQRREYPVSDYWWVASDEAQLRSALDDALNSLERYGLAWLAAPEPPKPWEMPAHRLTEFAAAVQQVLAPPLAQRGYQLEQWTLADGAAYSFFFKELTDGSYALLELQAIYSLDPAEFSFDVRLQRRPDCDPLTPSALAFAASASLTQLAWGAHHAQPLQSVSVAEARRLLWPYRDRVELEAQLHAALQDLVQVGLPWVEQAAGLNDKIKSRGGINDSSAQSN